MEQLILRMLRDLILQSRDSRSLNGDPLHAGFPLVDIFCTKGLFLRRTFLTIENIKKTPQIKSEAVVQRYSLYKRIHRKTSVPEFFLNKVTALRPATLLKKRLWYRRFYVNLVKFARAPFFIELLWWLLL